VNEANSLATKGFDYDGTNIKLKVIGLLADAPARSLCASTISHNAVFGCAKCCVVGRYVKLPGATHGRMTFPDVNAALIDDFSFRNRSQAGHHKKDRSELENLLSFDMIRGIPGDPMHMFGKINII